ncbi:MAG: helix-turn-helix transcriptional regulator [Chloroflexi bacterium]|nr:helix-turn-helix transcriptional regulator [Chloroflexota bacterium]
MKRVEPKTEELEAVKVYKALGDPTRFRIVRMLTERQELGCGDLQGVFGLSAPALSHHTRVLQECGLISMRREGPFHFFRLRPEQLQRFAPALLSHQANEAR